MVGGVDILRFYSHKVKQTRSSRKFHKNVNITLWFRFNSCVRAKNCYLFHSVPCKNQNGVFKQFLSIQFLSPSISPLMGFYLFVSICFYITLVAIAHK